MTSTGEMAFNSLPGVLARERLVTAIHRCLPRPQAPEHGSETIASRTEKAGQSSRLVRQYRDGSWYPVIPGYVINDVYVPAFKVAFRQVDKSLIRLTTRSLVLQTPLLFKITIYHIAQI